MTRDAQGPDDHELSTTRITPLHHNINHPEQSLAPGTLFEPLETSVTSRSRADYTFPEGGLKAWLVVAGSFSIISGTYGLISSVGLFQSYWQEHQLSSYTTRDVSWIAAVNVFLNLFLGVQIGPLFDRHGPRGLIAFGSVVYVISLVLLAQCKVYWHFMLVYGILSGSSSAFLTTTALAVVAHWFERKRGMASGIAFVGSSVGGIAFPLILKPVFEHLSWVWSIRIVALIVLVLMIIGNLCIRGRLPPRKNGGVVDLKCFLDARFSWCTIGVSCKFCLILIVFGMAVLKEEQASNLYSSGPWDCYQHMLLVKVSATRQHSTLLLFSMRE
jgi:MFS family permease